MSGKMRIETTGGLIIDMQERLLPVMAGAEQLVTRVGALIRGLAVLGVPLHHTEQYPQGLGATVAPIAQLLSGAEASEKLCFSCCDSDPVRSWLGELQPEVLIVAGIETHVCVLQTALDLIELGLTPVVVADAVSSRHEYDKEIALHRLQHAGAVLVTTESVLFELLGDAGGSRFKQISAIAKEL